MSHCIDKLVVSSVMTKSAHSNIRPHIHHRNLKGSAWPAEKTLIIHRNEKKNKKQRETRRYTRWGRWKEKPFCPNCSCFPSLITKIEQRAGGRLLEKHLSQIWWHGNTQGSRYTETCHCSDVRLHWILITRVCATTEPTAPISKDGKDLIISEKDTATTEVHRPRVLPLGTSG